MSKINQGSSVGENDPILHILLNLFIVILTCLGDYRIVLDGIRLTSREENEQELVRYFATKPKEFYKCLIFKLADRWNGGDVNDYIFRHKFFRLLTLRSSWKYLCIFVTIGVSAMQIGSIVVLVKYVQCCICVVKNLLGYKTFVCIYPTFQLFLRMIKLVWIQSLLSRQTTQTKATDSIESYY